MPNIETVPLPINPQPYFSQRTTLGGKEFVLRFAWNARAVRWFLGIYDASESPIVTGIKLVEGLPLTNWLTDTRFASGDLLFLGSANTLEGLGDGSCSLTYVEP